MNLEFEKSIREALPHTTSITPATDSNTVAATTNFPLLLLITKEANTLTVQFQPPYSWELLSSTTTATPTVVTNIAGITSFDSLHSLLGHCSRLYRQSFHSAVVAKLSTLPSAPPPTTSTTSTTSTPSTTHST